VCPTNDEHDAFAALAVGAIDRLHRIARLILGSDDRTADAFQESLTAAWLHIRAVRPEIDSMPGSIGCSSTSIPS
jgi:DNA-directed RNA polymerase specialized sigma24 family protein